VSVLAVRAHMNLRKNQVGYNDGGEDE
jgi:hypothetical protein